MTIEDEDIDFRYEFGRMYIHRSGGGMNPITVAKIMARGACKFEHSADGDTLIITVRRCKLDVAGWIVDKIASHYRRKFTQTKVNGRTTWEKK